MSWILFSERVRQTTLQFPLPRMSLTIYRQSSHPSLLSIEALRNRTIAVLGFGNQGEAHALNLRDSGLSVIVGSRHGSDAGQRAREFGFRVLPHPDAAAQSDLVIMAVPDDIQRDFYHGVIETSLQPGATLGFIHGYSIHFGGLRLRQDLGAVLVAPKGPGTLLRDNFVHNLGLPALVSVAQDSRHQDARELAFAWAAGIGSGRAGVIETTFGTETETDLFGEQAVLCGGLGALITAAFEVLVDAGYPPEIAYIECCHEVKQVADLIYAKGLAGMYRAISNTAEFGAYEAGPKVVDDHTKARLRALLDEIQRGGFAQRMEADARAGSPWFFQQQGQAADHPIERAGQTVRSLMPWLSPPFKNDSADNP